MSTGYLIGFIVLFVLQAISTPTFLKAEIPNPCKKSLLWKMISSTIFIITGVVAMMCSGNHTMFATLMIVGLAFSWLGDFLLHVKAGDQLFFVFGLFAFLIAHVFYVTAYSTAFSKFFPGESFLGVPETIALIVFTTVAFFTQTLLKSEFGEALFPVLLYMDALGLMVIKAFSLGIRIIASSVIEHSVLVGILLMVGAAFFAISDYTLAILCFKKGVNKHDWLRYLNIYTYFFGQMFLALTILYIIPA